MDIKNLSWDEALGKSYGCYLIHGARSTKKLYVPHYWIREKIKEYLDETYECYSYGFNDDDFNKELTVQGIAYNKRSDVTIVKNNKVKGVISFKFISSNYSQNSNNYFENLLGECFNIQANEIPFCHVLVIRDEIPYFDKNQDCIRTDYLKNHHLNKYMKILELCDFVSVPKKMCINVINLKIKGFENEVISPKDFKSKSDEGKNEILENIVVKSVYNYNGSSEEIEKNLKNLTIENVLKEFANIINSKQ